jgi:hypothetical protein
MLSGNMNMNSLRNTQSEMNELRNRFRGNEIDRDEYRDGMNALREQHEDARMAAVAAGVGTAGNVSNLFTYMNNSNSSAGGNNALWGAGTFAGSDSVFFNSGGELSSLQAMNSARIGIENRARSLVGEIARDRARGLDVSDRQEALGNLTGNLDILNRNLSSSIDRALGEGRGDSNFIDVVGRIRQSLVTVAPQEAEEPSFAPPSAFEGGPAEQAVAASQEMTDDEMSVAQQIAKDAQAEYAASIDIMSDSATDEVMQK